ncbi:MAG: tetratricopeptide repeat protein [Deltaproteobacteria bacterium]|nr:tetratricopeptide repeat protein [Deltaproteobacteria bacterium]
MWLLLAVSGALAGPVDDWLMLQTALLTEVVDGDVEGAAHRYERLMRELPAGSPTRTEALYQLGRARLALGDTDGAVEVFREGVRAGAPRSRCLKSLRELELTERAIHTIPESWTFDQPDHGFIHPAGQGGSIRIDKVWGDPALVWTSRASATPPHQLLLGFRDPSPAPTVIRFRLGATGTHAWVRITLVDVWGHRYSPTKDTVALPRGSEVQVDLALSHLQPLDGPTNLRPSELDMLILEDVTGSFGVHSGTQEITLDNFEVR